MPTFYTFMDTLLCGKLWAKYDKIKEPYRFFLAMGIILPPMWVLNGAVKIFMPQGAIIPRWAMLSCGIFVLYLCLISMWRIIHHWD